MTEGIRYGNGYGATSDLWQGLQKYAPTTTGMVEMFAPMLNGMFGMEIMPILNMFRVNRQDRPFYEADTSMTIGLRNQFRNMTGGQPSATGFQSFGRALASYFMDDKGLAESAVSRAAYSSGAATYAFGTGGRSLADVTGGWNGARLGSYNENLVGLMSSVYNTGFDPNVTKGQRQMMLAGMMRGDSTLVRDYASMRRLADEAGVGRSWDSKVGLEENLGNLRKAIDQKGTTDEATESLKKLVDRLDNTRKSIEAFGEAANTWGRVLRTDASTAMQRMQNLLGSDAFSMFQGNEAALTEMGLNVKHVGGITGRGSDSVLALASEAGRYLMSTGGPADTAVNVATNAMLQSNGMSGYRVTQEGADKMMTRFMADAQRTDASYLYFGGYQRFAEQQIARGSKLSQQEMIRQWDQVVNRNGLNVQTLNRALGLNYDINGYATASLGDFGRYAAVQQNGFGLYTYGRARVEAMNNILLNGGVRNRDGSQMTYQNVRQLSRAAGTDVMELLGTNPEEFNRRVNQIGDAGTRREVIRFRSRFGEAFRTTQRNNPNLLGSLRSSTANEAAAFLSDTNYERYVKADKQRELRAQISRGISGKNMAKSIGDLIRSNPNFTLGDVLSAAGGDDLSFQELDVIQSLTADRDMQDSVGRQLQAIGRTSTPEQGAFIRESLKKFGTLSNARDEKGRLYSKDRAYKESGLADILGGAIVDGKLVQVGGLEATPDKFKQAFGKWKAGKAETSGVMRTISKASFGKDLKNLNIIDKGVLAERMALYDIAAEQYEKSGSDVARKMDPRLKDLYLQMSASSENAFDKKRINAAYEEAKKAKINTTDLEKRKEQYMEQMGVQNDQASTAAILAQVADQVVRTIISTFGSGGSNALNVIDKTPQ